jgi:hypothetical protein
VTVHQPEQHVLQLGEPAPGAGPRPPQGVERPVQREGVPVHGHRLPRRRVPPRTPQPGHDVRRREVQVRPPPPLQPRAHPLVRAPRAHRRGAVRFGPQPLLHVRRQLAVRPQQVRQHPPDPVRPRVPVPLPVVRPVVALRLPVHPRRVRRRVVLHHLVRRAPVVLGAVARQLRQRVHRQPRVLVPVRRRRAGARRGPRGFGRFESVGPVPVLVAHVHAQVPEEQQVGVGRHRRASRRAGRDPPPPPAFYACPGGARDSSAVTRAESVCTAEISSGTSLP